jgi:predicted amidohydrolase YtcJ
VLSQNPLTMDPQRLQEVQVQETVKEGKTVYERPAGR